VLQATLILEVTNTSITGPLPSLPEGRQQQLEIVRLTGNPKLSGTLPPSWSGAFLLSRLDLSSNAISGSIPDAWANMLFLQSLNLAGNKLTGSIPRAWVKPSDAALEALNVSGNVGMKGCLSDVKGKPGESLPYVDASRTSLLECLKSKPALTNCDAPQEGWSPASCDVGGYTFKAQHLPAEQVSVTSDGVLPFVLSPSKDPSAPVLPFATLAETQAACDASDDCVMFTSDGYLVGVFEQSRFIAAPVMQPLGNKPPPPPPPAPWQQWSLWRNMAYCPGKCCGTWVAKDAAAAADNTSITSNTDSAGVQLITPPLYHESAGAIVLAAAASKRCQELRAGVANSFTCPSRCRVACCVRPGQEMSHRHLLQACV
jgi:hypothetical protein